MIEITDLVKVYKTKEKDFEALKKINLTINSGEFVAVLGESGSGKTTFLNMLSGVDSYTSGSFLFNGKDTAKFSESDWREIRNHDIGFIFQRFNLIDHLTVMENVILPLILTGSDKAISEKIALKLLKEVDLEGVENKLAKELSGGQRQRVAIARTIIINPSVILADEPTGALDSTTGLQILELLQKFAPGRIIIMVTHDETLAYDNATRVIRLHDGEIVGDDHIKADNKKEMDITQGLLTHHAKITKRNKKILIQQYPYLEDQLVVGDHQDIPLERKYISSNNTFTMMIARENFKQKIKVNRKIIWSFILTLSLLLIVNIFMKNITNYNFNIFEINNNYEQYLITDYDTRGDGIISYLEDDDTISETGYYYEHYLGEMYFYDEVIYPISTTNIIETTNAGVYSPKLVSLPNKEENFYLYDQIIAGNIPKNDGEILVSSEFLLSRFYGYSMDSGVTTEINLVSNLDHLVGKKLFVCGETLEVEGDVTLYDAETLCYPFTVSGILNSYYDGVNYTGDLFVSSSDFESYIEYMRLDLRFTRVDEYYDKYVYFYLNNFEDGKDIAQLSADLEVTVFNEDLTDYLQTHTLENLLNYVYIAIFVSLIIISGTIDINIVFSSVVSRTKEIGIYSCIGVSKKSIRRIFVFEAMLMAVRVVFFSLLMYLGIVLVFNVFYHQIIYDFRELNEIFGVNAMKTYELFFAIQTMFVAVLFLFVMVMMPSYKASNMKAIDALRS